MVFGRKKREPIMGESSVVSANVEQKGVSGDDLPSFPQQDVSPKPEAVDPFVKYLDGLVGEFKKYFIQKDPMFSSYENIMVSMTLMLITEVRRNREELARLREDVIRLSKE